MKKNADAATMMQTVSTAGDKREFRVWSRGVRMGPGLGNERSVDEVEDEEDALRGDNRKEEEGNWRGEAGGGSALKETEEKGVGNDERW